MSQSSIATLRRRVHPRDTGELRFQLLNLSLSLSHDLDRKISEPNCQSIGRAGSGLSWQLTRGRGWPVSGGSGTGVPERGSRAHASTSGANPSDDPPASRRFLDDALHCRRVEMTTGAERNTGASAPERMLARPYLGYEPHDLHVGEDVLLHQERFARDSTSSAAAFTSCILLFTICLSITSRSVSVSG